MPPDDSGEKTEAPTQRKRDESRQKGQVARSVDLSSALILLGALGALNFLGPQMFARMASIMAELLEGDLSSSNLANAGLTLRRCLWSVGIIVGPMMLTIVAAGILSNVMQVGFMITTEPLTPRLNKISPIAGFKRMFSMRSLIKLMMSLGKVAVIGLISYMTIVGRIDEILSSAGMDYRRLIPAAGALVFLLGIRVAVVLVILAMMDFLYQRWQHEQELRMSKQEVKEDLKRMEGDPQIRAQRQRIARQLAMQRMSTQVPTSTVVVTNPTHLSVALLYTDGMNAPKVVAKGGDFMAIRIRQLAAASGVPIIERRPLAQALYKNCREGDEIPVNLYQAVAEVLAYVYELSGGKKIGRHIPVGA